MIGVDFDNTIVCYDRVFHRAASERGLVPAHVAATKKDVQDYLIERNREDDWTELQGDVYGARMAEAEAFPGVFAFFRRCVHDRIPIAIISHKTRTPFRGHAYDLHLAARAWLVAQGFFDPQRIGIRPEQVYFEVTKQGKLDRIRKKACTYFIDDLPEFLSEPAFPKATRRLLFDPHARHSLNGDMQRVLSWNEIERLIPWNELRK